MRLKFMLGDGYRMVDVHEYSYKAAAPPTVSFVSDNGPETVELAGDVFVMNDKGDTIDRLRKEGR